MHLETENHLGKRGCKRQHLEGRAMLLEYLRGGGTRVSGVEVLERHRRSLHAHMSENK